MSERYQAVDGGTRGGEAKNILIVSAAAELVDPRSMPIARIYLDFIATSSWSFCLSLHRQAADTLMSFFLCLINVSCFCPPLLYRIISGGPKIGRYLLVNQTVVVIDSPFYCTPIARVLYDPCNWLGYDPTVGVSHGVSHPHCLSSSNGLIQRPVAQLVQEPHAQSEPDKLDN
jgi:hypothetical protein